MTLLHVSAVCVRCSYSRWTCGPSSRGPLAYVHGLWPASSFEWVLCVCVCVSLLLGSMLLPGCIFVFTIFIDLITLRDVITKHLMRGMTNHSFWGMSKTMGFHSWVAILLYCICYICKVRVFMDSAVTSVRSSTYSFTCCGQASIKHVGHRGRKRGCDWVGGDGGWGGAWASLEGWQDKEYLGGIPRVPVIRALINTAGVPCWR